VANLAAEFYELGCDAVYPVSAEHAIGIGDLRRSG
jgi:predicted GTPase